MKKNQRCRSVFVSFDSKNLRDRIFQAKKIFKGNKEGIYVNEPLTKNILKFTLSAEIS